MHPRNIYRDRTKTDFVSLSEACPTFKKYLQFSKSGSPYVDFKDPTATLALTKALLLRDFGLTLSMPEDGSHLVPTVPQKLNYILWIEDLLECLPADDRGRGDARRGNVSGIDIGTGASCIYALLGAKMNGWSFLATEIDPVSKRHAEENVDLNELDHLVKVKQVESSDFLCGALKDDLEYDFCMCNPPFYTTAEGLSGTVNRTERRPSPQGQFSGTEGEKITTGGEVQFVKRLFEDSLTLKTKIKWYTSMLGHKSSVRPLLTLLKSKISKVAVTEFVQGRTHRWAVGWSWCQSVRAPQESVQWFRKRKAKQVKSFCILDSSTLAAKAKILGIMEDLNISSKEEGGGDLGFCFQCRAQRNTWIHSRQQRRAKMGKRERPSNPGNKGSSVINLDFYLRLKPGTTDRKKTITGEGGEGKGVVCVELEGINELQNDLLLNQLLIALKNRLKLDDTVS